MIKHGLKRTTKGERVTRTTTFLAGLIAMSLAAGPAFSQTEETTETTETEQAETTENGLSLGEPVQNGPEIGEQYIAETFGDWGLRCLKTEAETDPCQLWQLLRDNDGNAVAEIAINPLPAQGRAVAGANLIVPLETYLTEQVTIQVDQSKGRQYPFAFCTQIGCVARIGLTAEDIAAYKAGAGAVVRIVPFAAPDQNVILPLSLTGFTAGYNALTGG